VILYPKALKKPTAINGKFKDFLRNLEETSWNIRKKNRKNPFIDKNKNLYPSNLINLWITISVSLQTHSGRWKGTNPSKCLSHGEAMNLFHCQRNHTCKVHQIQPST
jgi:hypothetical protein